MITKKVIGAMDCGCLILEFERIAGLTPNYYRIEYCDKHKANFKKDTISKGLEKELLDIQYGDGYGSDSNI